MKNCVVGILGSIEKIELQRKSEVANESYGQFVRMREMAIKLCAHNGIHHCLTSCGYPENYDKCKIRWESGRTYTMEELTMD